MITMRWLVAGVVLVAIAGCGGDENQRFGSDALPDTGGATAGTGGTKGTGGVAGPGSGGAASTGGSLGTGGAGSGGANPGTGGTVAVGSGGAGTGGIEGTGGTTYYPPCPASINSGQVCSKYVSPVLTLTGYKGVMTCVQCTPFSTTTAECSMSSAAADIVCVHSCDECQFQ